MLVRNSFLVALASLAFATTQPTISGGNPIRDVTPEDCKNSTIQDACQCIELATNDVVCSIASIPIEDAATQNQKFVIGWNKITQPFSNFQIKVFQKSLSSLSGKNSKTIKEMIGSMYQAEEESIKIFRQKIRENIDIDIGTEKDPTGDPNAKETLDQLVARLPTNATNNFFNNMAEQYQKQLQELENMHANSSPIDMGNVLLNLIFKALMAISGMDITKMMNDAIDNSYTGKIKMPFCIANRYFEFDLADNEENMQSKTTTENYDGDLSGTGMNFGDWKLTTSTIESKSFKNDYKMGIKYGVKELLQEDSNGDSFQNMVVLNANIGNELAWAQSMINQSFVHDPYVGKNPDSNNPIIDSGIGLRKVAISRGDLRNSALNIFNAGRDLLNVAMRDNFRLNCTPSIIAQKGSKIVIQEYDIPRPNDRCESDETAFCPLTENQHFFGNRKEGKDHYVLFNEIFPNGLTMQCSATEYTKKVKCGSWGGKCTIRWRECYTLKKYYDFAKNGQETSDRQCLHAKRYNDWSQHTHEMEYYTGFHDFEYANQQECINTNVLY